MYDLVIIGAGPAGLTASIYASCFKLSNVVIGKVLGGQVALAPDILNYPGFDEISGEELTKRMADQVKNRGAEIILDGVTVIARSAEGFLISTESQKQYEAKSVILATGVERRKLNVPGEMEYSGKGVQYCAKCESFDYENKITAVVGGANAAAQTAVQLAHAATKVYIIYRGSELRCDAIWKSKIAENPKIEIIYKSQIEKIDGDGTKLTGVTIKSTNPANSAESSTKQLTLDRLYIEIGGVPGTAMLAPLGVKLDAGGFLEVDDMLATNLPGIYAAGDMVSHKYSIEQISSAVGLGARAAVSVFSYLKQQNAPTLWGGTMINRGNVTT